MYRKTISMTLDTKSIDNAIKELERYTTWVAEKAEYLLEKLATLGAMSASIDFRTAYLEEQNDVEVRVEKTKDGYSILANGSQVMFIEFGTGVYWNGVEPYPVPRPEGVLKIGEYGKGLGKNDYWWYTRDGKAHYTHGTPAKMPMYRASQEIEREVEILAQEIFK